MHLTVFLYFLGVSACNKIESENVYLTALFILKEYDLPLCCSFILICMDRILNRQHIVFLTNYFV